MGVAKIMSMSVHSLMNATLTSLISALGYQAHVQGIEMNVPNLLSKVVEAPLLFVPMETVAPPVKRVPITSHPLQPLLRPFVNPVPPRALSNAQT